METRQSMGVLQKGGSAAPPGATPACVGTMSRSDLLISLVRAGASGDKAMLRSTVEAMAAEERANKHPHLADKLTRALNGTRTSTASFAAPPSQTGRDFVLETTPFTTLDSLILPHQVRMQVDEIIEEHNRADLLRTYGLSPRHRILLVGPPGNGKTSLAEAVAEAMALPFFTVRYDALIGSFLGETNQRLRRLFDYIKTINCVLLFDEFDAIGKERGDVHETGEIKRLVSSLLLQMDGLPSYVVAFAATNHPELLDRAVWRRFQARLTLPKPTPEQVSRYISKCLNRLEPRQQSYGVSPEHSRIFENFSDVMEFCGDIQRRYVLCNGTMSPYELLGARLDVWQERAKTAMNGERSQ